MTTKAEMWKLYDFRGHRVRVIQQWQDPFGVPFVRIESIDDAAIADGMREAEFLGFAAIEEAGSGK
ncbi:MULTISPECIES: hypothetical protein [unclassified Bradyrhizobium]|uniref:hypothetical protein n=1 Tax=unclassified Bradyrhizobium TaxID=2631580 RepID=UPI00244A42B5|nr:MULTISPECIES: hypothetical protein [unclassified Bradyrhizobium]MDH2346147.1 hypothetical protein [Bradyrhizobium sp. SSUT77]MDH2350479.1 hypothetical protein [Bradyrhizobium sp. SSUT112]